MQYKKVAKLLGGLILFLIIIVGVSTFGRFKAPDVSATGHTQIFNTLTPSFSIVSSPNLYYRFSLFKVTYGQQASTPLFKSVSIRAMATTLSYTVPTTAGLVDGGYYTWSVQSFVDPAKNCQTFPFNCSLPSNHITFQVKVSTSVTPPSIPDLLTAKDTGFLNTDNITKLTNLTFTGTATPGSVVTLFDNSVCVIPPSLINLPHINFPSTPLNALPKSGVKTNSNTLSKILDIFSPSKALAGPNDPITGCHAVGNSCVDGTVTACPANPQLPDCTAYVPTQIIFKAAISRNADSNSVTQGSTVNMSAKCFATLNWNVLGNAYSTACTTSSAPSTSEWTGLLTSIFNLDSQSYLTPNNGYMPLSPTLSTNQTRNYTLSCTNKNSANVIIGTDTKTVTVNIVPPAIGKTTASVDGKWIFTANFSEGVHNITAQSTNAVGVKSAMTSALSVKVDTTAPIFSSPSPLVYGGSPINYTFSESMSGEKITFTKTSYGNPDSTVSRICNLKSLALSASSHTLSLANHCNASQTLVSGAVYNMAFSGKDIAGNNATVAFDPAPLVTNSLNCSTINGSCPYSIIIPSDVTKIDIEVIGGGGGGGGASGLHGPQDGRDDGSGGGGGGGAGQYKYLTGVNVIPGDVLDVQIGGAGSLGAEGYAVGVDYNQNNRAPKNGGNGSASYIKTSTIMLANADGGCGGTHSSGGTPGISPCGGGGGGSAGAPDAGGAGGGGGAISVPGSGGSGASNNNRGLGGVGGIKNNIPACVNSISKGGNGGNGGNNGADGHSGGDGICGGGGGAGGGTGSAAYNQCNGGLCGRAGGAGGQGGAGKVVVYYKSYLRTTNTIVHIRKYTTPGTYNLTIPTGFSNLKISALGGGGNGGHGGSTNCCSTSQGLGGAGGLAGNYQQNTFIGNLYSSLDIYVGAGGKKVVGSLYLDGESSTISSNSTVLVSAPGGTKGVNSGASGIGGDNGYSNSNTGTGGAGGLDPGCASDGLDASSGIAPGAGGGGGSGGRHCGWSATRRYGGKGGDGGNGQVIISYW